DLPASSRALPGGRVLLIRGGGGLLRSLPDLQGVAARQGQSLHRRKASPAAGSGPALSPVRTEERVGAALRAVHSMRRNPAGTPRARKVSFPQDETAWEGK